MASTWAVYLLAMLILPTLLLMLIWACDTLGQRVEAGSSLLAQSEPWAHPPWRQYRVRPPSSRRLKLGRSLSGQPRSDCGHLGTPRRIHVRDPRRRSSSGDR